MPAQPRFLAQKRRWQVIATIIATLFSIVRGAKRAPKLTQAQMYRQALQMRRQADKSLNCAMEALNAELRRG